MSERPTPETDASRGYALTSHYGRSEGRCLQMDRSGPFVHAEVARKLERERDHARAEAERWRDNWKNGRTMSMIISTGLPWENASVSGHHPFDASEALTLTLMKNQTDLVRHVLLLCSYCGEDNPECCNVLPCDDCMRMCNVVEIDEEVIEVQRIQGQFDQLREDRISNLPNDKDLARRVPDSE